MANIFIDNLTTLKAHVFGLCRTETLASQYSKFIVIMFRLKILKPALLLLKPITTRNPSNILLCSPVRDIMLNLVCCSLKKTANKLH